MSDKTKIVIDTEKSVAPEGYEFTGLCEYDPEIDESMTHPSIHSCFYLKKKKWVPKEGDIYFYFDSELDVQENQYSSLDHVFSAERVRIGNCFKTREKAVYASRRIKAVLAEYQEEIGG